MSCITKIARPCTIGRKHIGYMYISDIPKLDNDSWFTITPTWMRKSSLYNALVTSNTYNQLPHNRSILKHMPRLSTWPGNNPDFPSSPYSIENGLNDLQTSKLVPPKLLFRFKQNNTFATLTGIRGRLLAKWSSGTIGFKGTQKLSSKAAMAMIDQISSKLSSMTLDTIRLDFRGVNPSRQLILAQIKRTGIKITEIMDSTPIALTGGPRPKKARRI